ncbi:MAG: 50S ribosomal protein L25 [bacterium]
MAQQFQLKVTARQGKSNALRNQDIVPAVLYGHGIKSQALQVERKAFTKVLKEAGHTSLINLSLGTTKHTVLVREVQVHPVKSKLLHVDFYQVRLDEKITAHVPLNFVGESPAVKDQGGVLVRNLDELELEALPQDLPHDIKIDISVLKAFEEPIRVADLKLPMGVELLHEPEEVIALVQPPRTEEELEAELAEEVTEDVQGVEGVKEEEAGEGEETEEGEETKKASSDQATGKQESATQDKK